MVARPAGIAGGSNTLRGNPWIATAVALLLLLSAFSAASQASAPPERREILATGSFVPGLGRIGTSGLDLLGIDNLGRVLLRGYTSDGRVGLYRADTESIATIWSEPYDPLHLDHSYFAGMTASGRIVQLDLSANAIPLVQETEDFRLVAVSDTGPSGERLCELFSPNELKINDVGSVLFRAITVPAGRGCNNSDFHVLVLYLASDSGLREVARRYEMSSLGWRLVKIRIIGVANDDTVFFEGADPKKKTIAIFASGRAGTRALVSTGDDSSSLGTGFSYLMGLMVNGRGDLLFSAKNEDTWGLYRFTDGRVETVAAPIDTAFYPTRAAMNSVGDIVVSGAWEEPDLPHSSRRYVGGMIVYSQNRREILRDGGGGLINDRGDLAFLRSTDSGTAVAFRRDGEIEEVAATGDPAPDGGFFGMGGVGGYPFWGCLDTSGVLVAPATSGQKRGLVCAADAGIQLLAREGDPAPEGGEFYDFEACRFVSATEILFTASKIVSTSGSSRSLESSLYRATPEGIDLVLSPADLGTGGGTVDHFAAGGTGTVVVYRNYGQGGVFVRRRRGERIEHLPLSEYVFADEARVAVVTEYELTDDDAIVAGVRLAEDGAAWRPDQATAIVLLSDDGPATILATVDDPRLEGGPFEYFDQILLADRHLVFRARVDHTQSHVFQITLDAGGAVRRIIEGRKEAENFLRPDLHMLTPSGRLLLRADVPYASIWKDYVFEEDELRPLPVAEGLFTRPIAITDRGNVFHLEEFPANLTIAGPRVAEKCFAPPTVVATPTPARAATATPRSPTREPTRTVTQTSRPTPTPSVSCDTTESQCVRVVVDSLSARPGERTAFRVRVESDPWSIVAVESYIAFPPAVQVVPDDSGNPACTVDPGIGSTLSAFLFRPRGCTPMKDCRAVRAVIVSIPDLNPFPDGSILFSCALAVPQDVASGRYSLVAGETFAADPRGNEVPAIGISGEVVIATQVEFANAETNKTASDDGCVIGTPEGGSANGGSVGLIVGLVLLAVLRRRAHSRNCEGPRAIQSGTWLDRWTGLGATPTPRLVELHLSGMAGSLFRVRFAGSTVMPTDSRAVTPSSGSQSSGPKMTRPAVTSPMNSI